MHALTVSTTSVIAVDVAWGETIAIRRRRAISAHLRRLASTLSALVVAMRPPSGLRAGTATSTAARDTAEARFQRDVVTQLDAAYSFARFLSRDADAAQDIVQDAFLRAYRSFDNYKGGDPRAWIFAIIRNCYHDWLLERRRRARHEVDGSASPDKSAPSPDVAADEDDPETAMLRRSDAGLVRAVLNGLPRPLREILVLREIEGLSYRQIADVAALPIGTVMSRLARARGQFQQAWHEAGQQDPAS